ncbi:MAG: tetratricopeptide repeat protein [Spirochaetota bacterium]
MYADFVEANRRNCKALSFTLKKRSKGTLVVVSTSNETARSYVQQFLIESDLGYEFLSIDLSGKEFGSLTNHLKRVLPEDVFVSKEIKHIIQISGLENHALEVTKDEEGKSVFGASKVIQQINFERERIFREIPAILILFLDNYTIKKLQDEAGDFWDWVNNFFSLVSVEEEIYAQDFTDTRKLPEAHYTPERVERIKQLKINLATLDQSLPEARYFKSKINLKLALAKELEEVRGFQAAIIHLKEALGLVSAYKISQELIPEIYFYIARNYHSQRKWEDAIVYYDMVIERLGMTNDSSIMVSTYHHIGMVYEEQGKWNESFESYKKAIDWNEKTKNLSMLGRTYHQIGMLYQRQGKWNESLEYYQRAIDCYEKTNNLLGFGTTYFQIGTVYEEQQKLDETLEYYDQAIEWFQKTNFLDYMEIAYQSLAGVYDKLGNSEKVEEYRRLAESVS